METHLQVLWRERAAEEEIGKEVRHKGGFLSLAALGVEKRRGFRVWEVEWEDLTERVESKTMPNGGAGVGPKLVWAMKDWKSCDKSLRKCWEEVGEEGLKPQIGLSWGRRVRRAQVWLGVGKLWDGNSALVGAQRLWTLKTPESLS